MMEGEDWDEKLGATWDVVTAEADVGFGASDGGDGGWVKAERLVEDDGEGFEIGEVEFGREVT